MLISDHTMVKGQYALSEGNKESTKKNMSSLKTVCTNDLMTFLDH